MGSKFFFFKVLRDYVLYGLSGMKNSYLGENDFFLSGNLCVVYLQRERLYKKRR